MEEDTTYNSTEGETPTPISESTPTPTSESTPTPTDSSFTSIYTEVYDIIDYANKDRPGTFYGGVIEHGGDERGYKNIGRLPNDTGENLDNTVSYVKVNGDDISATNVTISCWIRPTGESATSSGIVLARPETGKLYGLIMKPNGNELNIGCVWGVSELEEDIDFGVSIPKDEWSHVVLMVYRSGISKLFINGIYEASHDIGYVRKPVILSNIEVGRFSGLIDDVMFFSKVLSYGSIQLKQTAKYELAHLYSSKQTEFQPDVPLLTTTQQQNTTSTNLGVETYQQNFTTQTSGVRFYYKQESEYKEAHDKYVNNTLSKLETTKLGLEEIINRQRFDELDEQKFTIVGGPNAGTRSFADGKFRTIAGEITEL